MLRCKLYNSHSSCTINQVLKHLTRLQYPLKQTLGQFPWLEDLPRAHNCTFNQSVVQLVCFCKKKQRYFPTPVGVNTNDARLRKFTFKILKVTPHQLITIFSERICLAVFLLFENTITHLVYLSVNNVKR